MKLHAHPISTVSRPVMLFIADNKIDCETVVVDLMTGEHMQEPFAKLNPNKLVPVLEDGDLVLTESSAILKYLAEKIGSSTYPKDLVKRAKVNEMMDWFNTGLYRDYGYNMIYPQVYPHHKRSPDEANKTVTEWGKAQAQNWLGVLNDHYLGSGQKYLCGGDLSIAVNFFFGIARISGATKLAASPASMAACVAALAASRSASTAASASASAAAERRAVSSASLAASSALPRLNRRIRRSTRPSV